MRSLLWGRDRNYCLPTVLDRGEVGGREPRTSNGAAKWVALQHNQSYLLPQDPHYRRAFHFEPDARVLGLLEELMAREWPSDRTVNDFGAGVGQYGHTLLSRAAPGDNLQMRSYDVSHPKSRAANQSRPRLRAHLSYGSLGSAVLRLSNLAAHDRVTGRRQLCGLE